MLAHLVENNAYSCFRLVDTRDGHIKKIKGSGEVPEFCLRPDFGQMPAYLTKRNRRLQRAAERLQYAEDNRPSLCKLISEEDRGKLLSVSYFYFKFQFLILPVRVKYGNNPTGKSRIRDIKNYLCRYQIS